MPDTTPAAPTAPSDLIDPLLDGASRGTDLMELVRGSEVVATRSNKAAALRLAAGRAHMVENTAPYLATELYNLMPVYVKGMMASIGAAFAVTRGKVLMLDPDKLLEWTPEQIAWALVHEINHVLRDHAGRADNLGVNDHELWNRACDCAINDDYPAAVWPYAPVTPQTENLPPKGLEEDYWHLLNARKSEDKGGKGGKGGGAGGKNGPKGAKGPPQVGTGNCGTAASGGGPGSELSDAIDKQWGKGDTTRAIEKAAAAAAIADYAEKHQGTVPLGLARWAEQARRPAQVRWEDQLRSAVRSGIAMRPGGGIDSYKKPNRRQAALGFGPGRPVLPVKFDTTPEVWVVVDTSGSMLGPELSAGLSEARHVIKAAGGNATFLACDADVHVVQKVRETSDLVALCKGGGGTDFRPVFDLAARARQGGEGKLRAPDVLVFYTDGYGTAPAEEPRFRTIWLLTGDHATDAFASWGKKIRIKTGTS